MKLEEFLQDTKENILKWQKAVEVEEMQYYLRGQLSIIRMIENLRNKNVL